MSHRVMLFRFAGLVLAISVLVGVAAQYAAADDLSRAQSHKAASLAIYHENDAFDDNRCVRRFHSSAAGGDFNSAAFTHTFSRFHGKVLAPAGLRKLYQLKVVFLI
jgi:hypothetical protein